MALLYGHAPLILAHLKIHERKVENIGRILIHIFDLLLNHV